LLSPEGLANFKSGRGSANEIYREKLPSPATQEIAGSNRIYDDLPQQPEYLFWEAQGKDAERACA
jgi:hypothetical protein